MEVGQHGYEASIASVVCVWNEVLQYYDKGKISMKATVCHNWKTMCHSVEYYCTSERRQLTPCSVKYEKWMKHQFPLTCQQAIPLANEQAKSVLSTIGRCKQLL